MKIGRQMFHLFFGLLLILLLYFDLIDARILFYVLILGIIISFLSLKFKIPVVYWLLNKFERKENLKRFPGKGLIFFVLGSLLVLKLFGKDIALASIVILSLGDSASNLIGSIGKGKHFLDRFKNIEGSIAGFVVSFLGVLSLIFIGANITVLEGFFASLIAMIAEAIEVKIGFGKIDDNLIIPLVAGTVMYLL